MGRLRKPNQKITNENSEEVKKENIHVFIDENGNVTQIDKIDKDRIKYCIDPYVPQTDIVEYCVIGISDPIAEDCTNGIGLGLGDNSYGYAKYE